MRTSKFDVPVEVLTEFLDASCDKGLNSTIVAHAEDEYTIEIDYEKAESSLIDELEEILENLIDGIEEESEEENEEEEEENED
jgi:hypothetical protein